MTDRRIGVVMITHDRRDEALASVGRLLDLPERPRVVVVDDGSRDGTAEALLGAYPAAEARLSALDGPQRTSWARRYVG
jgi:N-acetylglucosaminyl-diphospho-decaprenol L-rhamnosyltransferase